MHQDRRTFSELSVQSRGPSSRYVRVLKHKPSVLSVGINQKNLARPGKVNGNKLALLRSRGNDIVGTSHTGMTTNTKRTVTSRAARDMPLSLTIVRHGGQSQ